jgi:glycolate oxidase FAD binding subunit
VIEILQQDLSTRLQERVKQALVEKQPLVIRGGGSKGFLGRDPVGEPLELAGHSGIVNYEPTELVVTVRGGTALGALEQTLAEQGQILSFEPPDFAGRASIGGSLACNLSGPARPYAGAARDALLGITLLNGKGEILHFGGEVMKNVAGYDLSRLMAGAMGTLGVLLEVSLKVLPRPEREITLVQEGMEVEQALRQLSGLGRRPLPISGAAFHRGRLSIRLGGTEAGLAAAKAVIPGDELPPEQASEYWRSIKDQTHGFFDSDKPLWRLSVPANSPELPIEGECLYDWGGAQRWLLTDEPAENLFRLAGEAGGHATAFRRPGNREAVFQPLPQGLLTLHRRLKQAFDPGGIINPGRLYPEI